MIADAEGLLTTVDYHSVMGQEPVAQVDIMVQVLQHVKVYVEAPFQSPEMKGEWVSQYA